MKVSIVGTGYVGLVSGACLAELGHEVICIDIDPAKVASINEGKAPIHETGLPELLKRHVGGRLRATTDLAQAVAESEVTFIAVGTPARDGRIDLSHVEQAATEIGRALRDKADDHTVIVKSTVVPGTTDGTVRKHLESASAKLAGTGFGLGMNPEFLTEGTAVADFMNPDRLVLGGIDARTHEVLRKLYAPFDSAIPRLVTNTSTAEMIKYASNAVLATMISFSNEIARLCSKVGGIDATEVMRGVHEAQYFTQRAGGERFAAPITAFLQPGCGFGGSCLPKDVTALVGQGVDLGLDMKLLKSVLEINRGQPDEMLKLVQGEQPDLSGVSVTVLGIAFKPDTDDVRESPAFPIIHKLQDAGARVTAYDPVAQLPKTNGFADVTIAPSLQEAVNDAEIVMLVTRWDEFNQLPEVLQKSGRTPLVVDGRRMLDRGDFDRYRGIGV